MNFKFRDIILSGSYMWRERNTIENAKIDKEHCRQQAREEVKIIRLSYESKCWTEATQLERSQDILSIYCKILVVLSQQYVLVKYLI